MSKALASLIGNNELVRWIAVTDRVPDSRRSVLVWGRCWLVFDVGGPFSESRFLGDSRFNSSRDGGSFDIEKRAWHSLVGVRVTHWAEQLRGPR